MKLYMLKYHISDVFLSKNKQLNTYIQILKKINMSFGYIYSDLFKFQLNSDSFRF